MSTELSELKKEFEVVEFDKISKISLLSEEQKTELMAGVKYHPFPTCLLARISFKNIF
jgi:hypothetical protein